MKHLQSFNGLINSDSLRESLKSEELYDIIPESIKDIQKLFKKEGKKLYLVGGSVRDFIIGVSPKDFDLATDALPDEVMLILKGYRRQIHGKSFGVVVVFTDDQPDGIEIATFRSDNYDCKLGITRNPDVILSTDIEEDVKRRDIRINGLFYDLDKKEIIDLIGGILDIKNGVIGMIGDPELRIKEDPLRILRAIRMACRF